jgi:hypothetical protein
MAPQPCGRRSVRAQTPTCGSTGAVRLVQDRGPPCMRQPTRSPGNHCGSTIGGYCHWRSTRLTHRFRMLSAIKHSGGPRGCTVRPIRTEPIASRHAPITETLCTATLVLPPPPRYFRASGMYSSGDMFVVFRGQNSRFMGHFAPAPADTRIYATVRSGARRRVHARTPNRGSIGGSPLAEDRSSLGIRQPAR